MNHTSSYKSYTQFVLIFVFLVILAGGIVRTTQSGMGCPDWPRCFGMWIPPTDASQLPPDFEKYLSLQDIDHSFNAWHTWIEYINRLLGALLGFIILVHVLWSYRKFYKANRSIFWLSAGLLLLTGFEAWLGKTVVDTNLAVVKITLHLLAALAIAAIPILLLHKLAADEKIKNPALKNLVHITLAILLLQIILGTEVREQVDVISRSLDYRQREQWIAGLDDYFLLHRITAIITSFLCAYTCWKSLSYKPLHQTSAVIFVTVLFTTAIGFIMALLHIPAFAQPLHVLFSAVLFIALFNFRLKLV